MQCRKLGELEAQLIEEETAQRITALVEARVAAALSSEVVQLSLQRRLEEERQLLEDQVNAELERERQAAEEAERQRREAIERQKQELRKLEGERQQMEAAVKARHEQEEQAEAQRRFQELQVGVGRDRGYLAGAGLCWFGLRDAKVGRGPFSLGGKQALHRNLLLCLWLIMTD